MVSEELTDAVLKLLSSEDSEREDKIGKRHTSFFAKFINWRHEIQQSVIAAIYNASQTIYKTCILYLSLFE